MDTLRELRSAAGVTQREFANLLSVSVESLRTWDSGRRSVPFAILRRATSLAADHRRRHEPLPLQQLAAEFHVHIRTLQAAARTGRLEATFSVRSAFGRPIRRASRAATEGFLSTYYRCYSGQAVCPLPLPAVPDDYDVHVRQVRRRLSLTQSGLAQRIGAANKAVIYQWESRKRRPSPVLWQRVMALAKDRRPSSLNPGLTLRSAVRT